MIKIAEKRGGRGSAASESLMQEEMGVAPEEAAGGSFAQKETGRPRSGKGSDEAGVNRWGGRGSPPRGILTNRKQPK